MIKTGKKCLLKSECGRFKVEIGTVVNYLNPRSVYIKITSWLSYCKNDEIDYKKLIKDYRNEIKKFLLSNENYKKYFTTNTIIDIKISDSRIRLGKVTFFDLDITLFQKNYPESYPFSVSKESKNFCLKPVLTEIACDFLNKEMLKETFNFSYRKNEAILIMNEKA